MISKHSEYLGTAREIAHGIVREQAEQVYSCLLYTSPSPRDS